ncbi:hypothetical protein SRHO_G00004880 [Serrasalmus rhombeus]
MALQGALLGVIILLSDVCKTYGSGVIQSFSKTLFYLKSTCPVTLTRFTLLGVNCDVTVQRGSTGLMTRVEILVNKVTTVLQDGRVTVEGNSISLPFEHTYQHVYQYGVYIKLRSKVLPFSITWRNHSEGVSSLWMQLDNPLVDGMTGMCGLKNSGTVLNDRAEGYHCVTVKDCPCVYGGKTYPPGAQRNSKCQSCVCVQGKWTCSANVCPPTCNIEGQFVTTFDGKQYSVPGKCTYVAARGFKWKVAVKFSDTDASIAEMYLEVYQEKYTFSSHSVKLGQDEITDLSQTEIFAEEKCSLLRNTSSVFARCHDYVPVSMFFDACVHRTCQCTSGLKDCLCVALSNYVKACASQGINIGDWRAETDCNIVCNGNLRFSYNMQACNQTCRSLTGRDPTCEVQVDPVEGCGCMPGTHLNTPQECSPSTLCMCHYQGGSTRPGPVTIDGRECICRGGQWYCEGEPCPGVCEVFGNGQYNTFDSMWYRFDGNCQYTLVEDATGDGHRQFAVRVESVPCCDEALTCSRAISVDLQDVVTLILRDMNVTQTLKAGWQLQAQPLYSIHTVGLHIIISVPDLGLTVIWDKNTRVKIKLQARWKGKVRGLCGNFDGKVMNDLLTSSSSVVFSTLEFGNSWKTAVPPCSDVTQEVFPCERHSYCEAWAQRRCMILQSDTFRDCHLKVLIQHVV